MSKGSDTNKNTQTENILNLLWYCIKKNLFHCSQRKIFLKGLLKYRGMSFVSYLGQQTRTTGTKYLSRNPQFQWNLVEICAAVFDEILIENAILCNLEAFNTDIDILHVRG